MKKTFLFLVIFSSFFSCKDDNVLIENDNSESAFTLRSVGDGKYDALGCGYDVTGTYFTANDVRGQVIDNAKIEKLSLTWIDKNDGARSLVGFMTGSTAADYTQTLTNNADVTWNIAGVKPKLFGGSIKYTYNSTYKYYSKYSFSEYNHTVVHQTYTYLLSEKELLKYVTDEFKTNVNKESPEFIISKYGTNVLTNVVIGARLRMIYRCQVANTSLDVKSTVQANANAGINKVFSINAGGENNTISKNDVFDEYISYQTFGGDPSAGLVGEIPLNGATIAKVDVSKWISTCVKAPNRMQIIDIRPKTALPIWLFVEDPTKREALKNAVIKYLQEKELQDILSGIPLRKYKIVLGGKSTAYELVPKDKSEYDGLSGFSTTFLGVEGAISMKQLTDMVPLYKYERIDAGSLVGFYRFKTLATIYTADWNRLGYGGSGWIYKGIIGYVYDGKKYLDTSVSGTTGQKLGFVPIYSFYANKPTMAEGLSGYFTSKLSESFYQKDRYVRWDNTGPDFWLLPVTTPQ